MKITAQLGARSLNKALKQLDRYQQKVDSAPGKIVHKLTEEGVSMAQQNAIAMDAIDTGDMIDRIDSEYRGDAGYVVSSSDHAAFVEFGTGVVGSSSPHPLAAPNGWQYDVNEHGEAGWWYYDRYGNSRWTAGMASRPYMQDTGSMLKNRVVDVAKQVMR